jgi:hypothetical protein
MSKFEHYAQHSPIGEERIMKNSGKCPKCQSIDIVGIPGKRAAGGAGNLISVGLNPFSTVKWLDAASDIARVKARYA